MGSASISGGQLLIPNASSTAPAPDYLELPTGILTNSVNGIGTNANDPTVTVEAWATVYPGQYTWANLFDFGSQNSSGQSAYDIHVAVHANPSDTVIGISDSDNANVHYQFWDGGSGTALDGNTNMHIVAVFNPVGGYVAIYTNGVLMGESTATISMAGVIAVLNKVGADNWPDPGMQGSIDELRIYNGALEPDDGALTQALGPNVLPGPKLSAASSGHNVVLSWPTNAAGYSLKSRATVSGTGVWSPVTTTPVVSGANFQVTQPATNTVLFFKLSQ
jgi:hypothetical protein